MPERVIFWDIDRTIVRSSMERRFFSYLRRNRHTNVVRIILNVLILWFRLPPWKKYHVKLAYLRGRSVKQVEVWVTDVWHKSIRPNLYKGAVDAVRTLKTRPVEQVLLSGTPMFLADKLGEHLDIKDIIAAEPEIRDGKYTGSLTGPHPHEVWKLRYAEQWMVEHGYDWNDAVVVADHFDDRIIMSRAGHRVVVKPDERMQHYSRMSDWIVVDDLSEARPLIDAIMKPPKPRNTRSE